MKLTFANPDWNKNTPKLVEWAVFLGFCAAAAWCFWFYYDLTRQIEKTEASNIAMETTIKENLWQKATEAESERAKNFQTPPNITRDPFK